MQPGNRLFQHSIAMLALAGVALGLLAGLVLGPAAHAARADGEDEDSRIARMLAEVLVVSRTVVSDLQPIINSADPHKRPPTADTVLTRTRAGYRARTGRELPTDTKSREGRLVKAQLDAIRQVIDSNEATFVEPNLDFKGFVPATFARLVNETFSKTMSREAEIKLTAPADLVRYRKSLPDNFEAWAIDNKLLRADWVKGQPYAQFSEAKGRPAFRVLVPEYYTASCLACHGKPRGEIDVTGYPMEGARLGDLGSVISVTLYQQRGGTR